MTNNFKVYPIITKISKTLFILTSFQNSPIKISFLKPLQNYFNSYFFLEQIPSIIKTYQKKLILIYFHNILKKILILFLPHFQKKKKKISQLTFIFFPNSKNNAIYT